VEKPGVYSTPGTPSGRGVSSPVCSGICIFVAQSLIFCLLFCVTCLFVFFIWPLHCFVYGFWLPYRLRLLITLSFTASDYPVVYGFRLPCRLRLLITLSFTASDYPVVYGFWLPCRLRLPITLSYLQISGISCFTDYPFSIFKLLFSYINITSQYWNRVGHQYSKINANTTNITWTIMTPWGWRTILGFLGIKSFKQMNTLYVHSIPSFFTWNFEHFLDVIVLCNAIDFKQHNHIL
jgi:hypothetical protein